MWAIPSVHSQFMWEEVEQGLVSFLQVSLMIVLFYFQGSCFSYTGKLVGVVQWVGEYNSQKLAWWWQTCKLNWKMHSCDLTFRLSQSGCDILALQCFCVSSLISAFLSSYYPSLSQNLSPFNSKIAGLAVKGQRECKVNYRQLSKTVVYFYK